jgi:hypothetical protein
MLLGVEAITMQNKYVSVAIPVTRVRFAEEKPANPVYEVKDGNVIDFAKFRAYQENKHDA